MSKKPEIDFSFYVFVFVWCGMIARFFFQWPRNRKKIFPRILIIVKVFCNHALSNKTSTGITTINIKDKVQLYTEPWGTVTRFKFMIIF